MKRKTLAAAQPANNTKEFNGKSIKILFSLYEKFARAIEKEDNDSIKSVLNEAGEDLLEFYSSYDDSLKVKQILEAYKKYFPGQRINISPYFYNVAGNYVDTPKLLADQLILQGDDLNSITEKGYTVLYHLAENGKFDLLKYLVDLMAQNNMSVDVEAPGGYPPIYTAVVLNKVNIVRCLAPHSQVISTVIQTEFSPLHIAAEKGLDEILKILLPHCGKTIHVFNGAPYLQSPLHMAACFGKTKAVHLLIEHAEKHNESVNPSAPGNDFSPLHAAAKLGFLGCVKRIVKALNLRREDINPITEKMNSPFELAADNLHLDIVEFYFRHKRFDKSKMQLSAATAEKVLAAAIEAKNDCVVENILDGLFGCWKENLFSDFSSPIWKHICLGLLFKKDDQAMIRTLEKLFLIANTPQEHQIVHACWTVSLEQTILQHRSDLTKVLFDVLKNKITRKEMIVLCSPLANRRPSTQAHRSFGKLLAPLIKEEKEVISFIENKINLLKESLSKIRPANCMPGNEKHLQDFQEAYANLEIHVHASILLLEDSTNDNFSKVKELTFMLDETLPSLNSSYQSKETLFILEETRAKKEVQKQLKKHLQAFQDQLVGTQQFLSTTLRPFLSNQSGTPAERAHLRTLRSQLAETTDRCKNEIHYSECALSPTLEEAFAVLSLQEQGLHQNLNEIKKADALRKQRLAEEQAQKELDRVKTDIAALTPSLEKTIAKIRKVLRAAESNLVTLMSHADEPSLIRLQALQLEQASLNTSISEKELAITVQENAELDLESSKIFLANLYVRADDLAIINKLAVALTAQVGQEFAPLSAKLIEEKEALKQATLQKIQAAQLSFNLILQHTYYKNSIEKNKEHSLSQACDKYKQAAAKLVQLTEPVLNQKNATALQNILAGIETSIKKEEANIAVLASQLDDQLAADLLLQSYQPLPAAVPASEHSPRYRLHKKLPSSPSSEEIPLCLFLARQDKPEEITAYLSKMLLVLSQHPDTDLSTRTHALLLCIATFIEGIKNSDQENPFAFNKIQHIRNSIFHDWLDNNISERQYQDLYDFAFSLQSIDFYSKPAQADMLTHFFGILPQKDPSPEHFLQTIDRHLVRLRRYSDDPHDLLRTPINEFDFAYRWSQVSVLLKDLDRLCQNNDLLSIELGRRLQRSVNVLQVNLGTLRESANRLRHEGPKVAQHVLELFCLELAKRKSLLPALQVQGPRPVRY